MRKKKQGMEKSDKGEVTDVSEESEGTGSVTLKFRA